MVHVDQLIDVLSMRKRMDDRVGLIAVNDRLVVAVLREDRVRNTYAMVGLRVGQN